MRDALTVRFSADTVLKESQKTSAPHSTCRKVSGGLLLGEMSEMAARVKKRSMRTRRTLAAPVLADIVRRVVEVAGPQQILLFGSAARGTMGPNSDVDLLVVKSGRFHRGRLIDAIYRSLRGAGAAVDVIVLTPDEIERYRDDPCLIVAPALREGKVVYGS
jgi:predicted nucleotidyltransferase